MNNLDKRVEYVLDFFEFDRVNRTMKALEWEWAGSAFGIPEVWELKQSARNLLKATAKTAYLRQERVEQGTGGFWAVVDPSTDFIHLEFVVASADDSFYDPYYFEEDLFGEEVIDLEERL